MPADTYDALLGLLLQGTGNNNNTWGENANEVFENISTAIADIGAHTVTGAADLDLSDLPSTGAPEAREAVLNFTGTLTANQTVIVPNTKKNWIVRNGTSGNFTLSMKTASGSAVQIRQGGWCRVWCDGSNTIHVGPSTAQFDSQMRVANGTEGAPAYSFTDDPDSGMRRVGANALAICVNGADVLDITTSGLAVTGTLLVNGVAVIPPGLEAPYAGIVAPTGWLLEYGQAISRADFADLFGAITKALTGNTNSNTTLNNLSEDLRNLGLEGALIESTGIPTGTTIVSIDSATSLTLSQAASATASGVSIRILPYGQGDASTTFNVPDRRGRSIAGRDNMGGTAASRLTGQSGGVNGSRLNATGGAETHTISVAQMPSHNHGGATSNPTTNPTLGPYTDTGAQATSGSGRYAPDSLTAPTLPNHVHTISSQGGGEEHNNVQPTGISNFIIKT